MVVRQRDGRIQIAVLEDGVLVEHYVAREPQTSLIGNVYLGRVQNVLPSMEAAFVDIGARPQRRALLRRGRLGRAAAHEGGKPAAGSSSRSSPATDGARAGHQGPGRPQGRPPDQPGLPARPVPGLRAERLDERDLPQAARHRACAPQEDPQGGAPRGRGRHRAHRRRGRHRGAADPRRQPPHAQWAEISQGRGRQGARAAAQRARPAVKIVRDVFNEDFQSSSSRATTPEDHRSRATSPRRPRPRRRRRA